MSRFNPRSREPGARTADYEFVLPPELIATHPAERREQSRLLVLRPRQGTRLEHRHFYDLPEYLGADDLLVLNNSKVRPAALATTDGRLEVLLLDETSPRHWTALVKPGARAKPGMRLFFGTAEKPIEAEVLKTLPGGERVLRFFRAARSRRTRGDAAAALHPQAPHRARRKRARAGGFSALPDRLRGPGRLCCPRRRRGCTSTPELLARFPHAFVTLHVGLGTFRPVKTEFIADHEMHEEVYSIPAGLEAAYENAKRVVAVGTHVRAGARVGGEPAPRLRKHAHLHPHRRTSFAASTRCSRIFHLPHSTLLMLVSALTGREKLLEIYREAIAQNYRFFSYGDAMLVL